ncbi:MAG: hypothetical protein ACLP9S_02820 [Syntrophales bacterium]
MKKIGFIDIHPYSPMCRRHLSSPAADRDTDDQSVIYVFKGSDKEYDYDKSLNYNSEAELAGIDEFYVSIPLALLDFRILNFPFSDREKIKKVLPIELDNLVLGGSEGIVFDIIMLADVDNSVDVLVAYTGRHVLDNILAELARRNIDPRVVTSIDLQTVDKTLKEHGGDEFSKFVTERLLDPRRGSETDRVAQAKQEISKPTINLRTGQFVYKKDAEKTGKALRLTVLLAFSLAIVIHANILFQTIVTKNKINKIAKDIHVSYSGLFPGENRSIDELYQLKSHIKEITEKNDALSGVNVFKFLLDLSKGMETDVVYTDIQIDKALIKLKGEASTMDELTKVQIKLSELLPRVSVSDVKTAANGKILFTVIAGGQ